MESMAGCDDHETVELDVGPPNLSRTIEMGALHLQSQHIAPASLLSQIRVDANLLQVDIQIYKNE